MLYEIERNAYFVICAYYKVTFIVFYQSKYLHNGDTMEVHLLYAAYGLTSVYWMDG